MIPAIDLRKGNVVRLSQGRPDRATTYSQILDPVVSAWMRQGATWLHIVNLDEAFGETSQANEKAIERIIGLGQSQIHLQLGGGLRTLNQIETKLKAGIRRVVLGTAAIEDPSFGYKALDRFGPERIAFGFDVLDGNLMVRGWRKPAQLSPRVLGEKIAFAGGKTVIYTNIHKDGMQTGIDWQFARELSRDTGLEVIVSGGTTSLEDIRKVSSAGLAGLIIGRALYENNFTLAEALNVG